MLGRFRGKRDVPSQSGPGAHNPNVIDLVTRESGGHIILYVVASQEWFAAGRPLQRLAAKVGNYLDYVASGQLVAANPALAGAPVCIRLRYPDPVDPPLQGFVEDVRRRAREVGVEFEVEFAPELRA